MTSIKQWFVVRKQRSQVALLRFWENIVEQSLLIRPVIGVEAVICSKRAGKSENSPRIRFYEHFQILRFAIVSIKRNDKVGILFS